MALSLITGRAHTGKGDRAIAHIRRAVGEGRSAWLLLPTHADVLRARESLARDLPIGAQVATFDDWLESLWVALGDGRRFIDDATRAWLCAEVCRDSRSFSKAASTPGFAHLVGQVAGKACGPELVVPDRGPARQVSAIVEEYRRRAETLGLVERIDAAHRLATRGVRAGQSIAAYGFTNLSLAQEPLLTAAAAHNEVLVALTWERDFPATECLSQLVERLEKVADSREHLQAAGTDSELSHLERELFIAEHAATPRGQVVPAEASGAEAEAALAARLAAQAVEDGSAPEMIAVCFPDLANRMGLLAAALSAQGIEYEMDVATPLRATPFGKSLLALSRLAGEGATRADAITFLGGPHSGTDQAQVDEADVRIRRARIDAGGSLRRIVESASPAATRAVKLARLATRDPRSLAIWQELAIHLLETGYGAQGRSAVDMKLDAAACSVVCAAVRSAMSTGAPPVAADLLQALTEVSVSAGSNERAGAIVVTEAHRLRSRRFDMVIVGGLSAAEFSSESREKLADSILAALGVDPGSDQRLEARMSFYMLMTRARARLVLLRQAATADGQEVRASAFWDDVVDLYRTPEQADEEAPGTIAVTEKMLLSNLVEAAPTYRERRHSDRKRAASGDIVAPGLQRGFLDAGASLAAADEEFSVTELEVYHACPYSWFFSRRLTRAAELDREFDAREKGTVAHRLVQEFYAAFRASGQERITHKNLTEALALCEDVSAQAVRETKTKGLAEELALASALEWVRASLAYDAELFPGFRPIANEWRFGAAAERPFSLGGVALRGSIDRVDQGAAGVVVTDYKSSKDVGDVKKFAADGRLQVVVYGAAASTIMDAPLCGAVYRSLSSGAVRGWHAGGLGPSGCLRAPADDPDQQWCDLQDWAVNAIKDAADGIRAAHITPEPRFARACGYCAAAAFCGMSRA